MADRRARGGTRRTVCTARLATAALLLAAALGARPAAAATADTVLPPDRGPTRDPLVIAYLQAALAHTPGDLTLRLRLVREQVAVGKLGEAEETLAPALAGVGSAAARALALDLALTGWRAAAPGTPARARSGREALDRLRAALDGAGPDLLPHLAQAALELGDPALAARAHHRLAEAEPARCAPWLSEAARDELASGRPGEAARSLAGARACERDPARRLALGRRALDAYRAAGDGAESLRLVEALLAEHPSDDGLLREAERVALERRSDVAARAYERLAATDPARCGAWLARAAAADAALGDPGRAGERYARAADCERDDRQALVFGRRALASYLAADRGHAALALAQRLVRRFPRDEALLREAGRIALAQGDVQGARQVGAQLAAGSRDPEVLRRQIELELAARDPAAALAAAQELERVSGPTAELHLRIAQLATWADRPAVALQAWMALARRGVPADAAAKALELARALDDGAALAELLTRRAAQAPLTADELVELARALEREQGSARALAALRAEVERRPESRAAWSALERALEKRGDLAGLVACLAEEGRRFGETPRDAVRAAEARWAMGEPRKALEGLARLDPSADLDARASRLMGALAWSLEDDARALTAYRALWSLGEGDALAAERLMTLAAAAGHGEEVARVGREAWKRLHAPRLFVVAMSDAADRGAFGDLRALLDLARADEGAFAADARYWLLRGRAAEHEARTREATAGYRRALALDPASGSARAALLWLEASTRDREALAVTLAAWSPDAWDDPLLRPAYAASLEELGYRREALAYYARDASERPGDAGAADRYARARARAGGEEGALAPPDLGGLVRAEGARLRFSTLRADAGTESNGPLAARRLHAVAGAEALGSTFTLRAGSTGLSWDGRSPLGGSTLWDTEALLAATVPGLGGRTELLGGVSERFDGTVLRAGLAHARPLAPGIELRLDGAFQEPADESAALRLYGVRSRAGLAIGLAGDVLDARGGASFRSWSGREGGAIASGGLATLEFGATLRLRGPELRFRLTGSYLATALASGATSRTAFALGMAPQDVLPSRFTTGGAGVHAVWARLGRVSLSGDFWTGLVGPPARASARGELGVTVQLARDTELGLDVFAGNDSFASSSSVYGAGLLLTRAFPRSTHAY